MKKFKKSEEYKFGDYLWYLQNFDQFHEIPTALKEKEYKQFKKYLAHLSEYLTDFFRRVQPLTDFNVVDMQISIYIYYDLFLILFRGRFQLQMEGRNDSRLLFILSLCIYIYNLINFLKIKRK